MRYVVGLCLLALAAPIPAWAPTWTVCASGCDFTSIQAAVDAAQPDDTIELGPETFYENVVGSGTIRGAGRDRTVVDGGGLGPVFCGRLWNLSDMTIQNGRQGVYHSLCRSSEGCGFVRAAVKADDAAGPIEHGTESIYDISVDNCRIRNNDREGISICNGAGLSPLIVAITTTTISGNTLCGVSSTAELRSGPIQLYYSDTTLNVENSVIRNNGCGVRHGASYPSYSYAFIYDTTISGNEADGVVGDGEYTRVENSTISANGGHGIFIDTTRGESLVTTSTISGNEAGGVSASHYPVMITQTTIASNNGPGLSAHGIYAGRVAFFHTGNSIVANNSSGNCWDLSLGHNLSSDDCDPTQPTDMTNTDPLLLPLADNGGPTPTHALHPDSPAIDAGGDECDPTDQRGIARPVDGDGDGVALCDIGPFEYVPPEVLVSQLIEHVEALGLHHGIENGLLAKLNAALRVLTAVPTGNDHAAVNILGVFINAVEAQHGKKIAAADADVLIDAAEEIIGLLTISGQAFEGFDSIRTVGFRSRRGRVQRELRNAEEPE